MEMRRLQYIQTKQLKSQYLMQLLLCKRRMYNQLYFGRGKPAPLRKARVIEQMRNHISTQMIAVRKASGIVRFWARVANDKNIKKRSQHITVTAFIDYCFV